MIYKYRDRDFTGIDSHMFVHNGITEENAPFYVKDLSGQANTLTVGKTSGAPTVVVEKSSNGINWESMEVVNDKFTATVPANGRLYLRCSTTAWDSHSINLTGNYEVGGNIMSLLYGRKYTGREESFPSGSTNNFQNLFLDSTTLVHSSNLKLPAATLKQYCYSYMFSGCTSMVDAPVLPVTTMADYCYEYMFNGCSALTTAPVLPATTLAKYCYQYMFNGCSLLTTAPTLPATTILSGSYKGMFENCSSLTTAPSLPAMEISGSCYAFMFYGCSSLTTAPTLPATTLYTACYEGMFKGCTGLTTVPTTLPATTLAYRCYYDMFRRCSSLRTAPILPAPVLNSDCLDCYHSMFYDSGVRYIKCLATGNVTSGYKYTAFWCQNVPGSGTFVAASNSTWTRNAEGIPSGWTVEYV